MITGDGGLPPLVRAAGRGGRKGGERAERGIATGRILTTENYTGDCARLVPEVIGGPSDLTRQGIYSKYYNRARDSRIEGGKSEADDDANLWRCERL